MRILNIMLLLCLSICGYSQEVGSFLIKNATVLTITDGIKENTDILIQDGIIKNIGQGLAARNIPSYDATGQYVIPGIIDAHSHIALSRVNEATKPVTAEVWVGDVLNPLDIAIYRALAGGVTITHAMHGSANVIGGQCETIKLRWGTMNPEELRMKDAPRTIKFALGENPIRVHGERGSKSPSSRMGVEQVIRQSFSLAQKYKQDWSDYKNRKTIQAPKYNLQLETISDILDGNIIIHCHSYRADEILMLVNVCKDFGIKKLCFQHANEGFKVAPELAEYGAHASVFSDWWAYKFEVYYSTAYNASILTKNGVITSINSDDKELITHLYHEAAKTQRYGGLTDNEALRLITINPAIQLGIDDRVGSIEVGKEGDLAIFKGHPLSIYSVCQKTIIDGISKFDINDDPSDMRVYINPEEEMPTFINEDHDHKHSDGCLNDVFDQLNEENHEN